MKPGLGWGVVAFVAVVPLFASAQQESEDPDDSLAQPRAEESAMNPCTSAGSSPGEDRANVPITTARNTWYLHVPSGHAGPIDVRFVPKPSHIGLLGLDEALPHTYEEGRLRFELPAAAQGLTETVVALTWTANHWDKAIAEFDEMDRTHPPAEDAVLFVGSSTIRMWDLARFFPSIPAENRGFGGSQFWDIAYHAERIITPYRPRLIVLYAGDNDVASGKSAAWVFADFKALIQRIRDGLPRTPIIVLGVKPSVARWNLWPEMQQVNQRIQGLAATQPNVHYLDLSGLLLGEDGTPRPDLFLRDGLHLNDEGYQRWTHRLAQELARFE
ncbi:MAG TPA: SGNH/GDSL hydrolase family protein [Candidatus Hydrogenedentes bacterium]|nr:SGNH/GDSL hydrolase family protein [Candidatus Hydrogenedentota bacterium]HPG67769.1 SGNH/GDSL hydrolase family protein [Candidatus Hydrogenedentota bacterium]